jgi:Domain of unknown function (DUF4365)
MRKQTRANVVGRQGERWFYAQIPSEWVIQRPQDDFGIDGIVSIGNARAVGPLEFGIQVKGSDSLKYSNGSVVISGVSREMVEYWNRKFLPTLLVAYDAKLDLGYADWFHEVVDPEFLSGRRSYCALSISQSRKIDAGFWAYVESSAKEFSSRLASAFAFSNGTIPAITPFVVYLRNLCHVNLADALTEDGRILYATGHAWTHVEVIREIDRRLATLDQTNFLHSKLKSFRAYYFGKCGSIFHEFPKLLGSEGPSWILVKQPKVAKPTFDDLTAALSEFVTGVLLAAQET